MNHPEIILIMARADNGVIGIDGRMPWHIPGDLRRFKSLTLGKPMIMGRKTFESLPGILPARRHIVLTRDTGWEEELVEIVHSPSDALAQANAPHIAVIGGAEIYQLFMGLADRIELTEVHLSPFGDTSIALPDPAGWQETQREDFAAVGDTPGYSFVTLQRRSG
ncbi:MAG: dihydrofolate reductase [Parasphingorhabdus sp.]|nr:dihydrofolate reductase [Parasphingorhabdus sp.]